ncbi:T9SS type A sorting domain-containing protein [Flavisericum labens]|uniref:T9SS type A sorting domain-containing protein n=1 Tax=Flavisericum labens TaxID=3377112 RepID=UPI00387AC151
MKKTLLLLVFTALGLQAQTTHDLNWEVGVGSNVDLTITVGDIVRWTWTDSQPHTVESEAGSTESFDSGTLTGNGSTFSYQFDLVGTNPYFCGIHPAMRGTITVEEGLSIDEVANNDFSILPNPARTQIFLKLPSGVNPELISVYNLVGQEVFSIGKIENSIDISSLNKGLYFLSIRSETLNHTKRFIKL